MSQENVEVVRRAFEGFNREGLAAFDQAVGEIFDPEVEMRALGRLPDTKQALRGHAALREYFAGLLATFEIHLEADEFIDAGDSVVVLFRQIARGRASGAELTNRLAFVYEFRNGRISCMDGYRTKAEALEAVGLRE
jgi:ketosteroid isomerase-like protein